MDFLLTLAVWLPAVAAAPATQANPCCEAISAALPGKVVGPSDQAGYQRIRKSYWTQQESTLSPACFVQPWDANDVSVAIKVLNQPKHRDVPGCKFAIKSGGHTSWAGAANIQDGVTIDLAMLKQVQLSPNRKFASVGPGNRWNEVYSRLEPLGLAVAGGRWGNVGVGGLLTGGGLSFFQGREGLACDGVLNHEVVIADGSIVNANATHFPDLHKALKGGNNNFGIVTRFDLKAFEQGDLWGGTIMSMPSPGNEALDWFQEFSNSSLMDPYSMTMFSAGSVMGYTMGGGLMTYSKPEAKPAVFKKLYDKSLVRAMGMTSYTSMSTMNGLGTPAGGRSVWASFSFANSAAFMKTVLALSAEKSKALPPFSMPISLIFQPVWHASRAKAFAATGGNALGLEETHDDVIVVLVMSASRPADEEQVKAAVKGFVDAATQKAKEMGVYSPYIYANYAAGFQDVIGGYGEKSRAALLATSRKYDPQQLFQKQVPGGYKLARGK